MEYTYDSILAIVSANGDLGGATGTASITGTFTIDLTQYQKAIEALDFKEFKDERFENSITQTAANPSVDQLLGISKDGIGRMATDTNAGSVLLNGDRIVFNAKDDFAMMFGELGVALGSPNQVNIDAGQTITLFGQERLFLGIPNKGAPYTLKKQAELGGTTKGDPTPDQLYEPMVLGIKLANLIEDILFVLKSAELVSGVSPVKFQPGTQADFALMANRIPEILSSYAYVDGYSHEQINLERLAALAEAQKKATDYTPPTQLTGSVEGTATVTGFPGDTADVPGLVLEGGDWQTIAANYIAKKESFTPRGTDDQGTPRAGYGSDTVIRNGKPVRITAGMPVTQQEAMVTLRDYSIPKYSNQIAKDIGLQYWKKLNNNQKAALVSMGYNTGAYTYSARSYGERIRDLIRKGDYQKAGEAFLQGPTTGAKDGKVYDGLVRRRKEESQMFLTPV